MLSLGDKARFGHGMGLLRIDQDRGKGKSFMLTVATKYYIQALCVKSQALVFHTGRAKFTSSRFANAGLHKLKTSIFVSEIFGPVHG